MRTKSIILLLIALGFGLVASIGMSQLAGGGEAAVPTAPVYVTTASISQGEALTEENVKLEQWPADKIPEGAVSAPEALENMVAVQPLFAGQTLVPGMIIDRNNQISAADRIKPGHVVVSVKVAMDTAVSHLIQPGDHVDIMAVNRERGKAELVLSNIEVFAINDITKRIVDEENGSLQAKTVSVQVTSDQASKLAYSADSGGGKLRLALRSKDDDDKEADDSSSYASSGVDPYLALQDELPSEPAVDNSFRMQIVSGEGKIQNYTWDDAQSEKLPNEVRDGTAPSFGGTGGGGLPPFQGAPAPGGGGEEADGGDGGSDSGASDGPRLDSVFSF